MLPQLLHGDIFVPLSCMRRFLTNNNNAYETRVLLYKLQTVFDRVNGDLPQIDIGGKMQNVIIFDTIWRKLSTHYTELHLPLKLFGARYREFPIISEPSLGSCSPFSVY
jgi:hypothetical protein